MKTITIIVLCNIISINLINAQTQKCYVCDQNGCDRPGSGDIQTCSDASGYTGGISGKSFVNGALGENNATAIYSILENTLDDYALKVHINTSAMPTWNSLTEWVCYVTQDKHRGCLIMAKGLCSADKSLSGQINNFANLINSFMQKAKNAITKMFASGGSSLTDDQKTMISNWFAIEYMTKLVNNSNNAQYQLASCCEGDACNFASMIQKSTAMLILLILSTLILV